MQKAIDEFLGHLAAEGCSPNTQSAYQSDLRGFFGFLRTDYPLVDRWQRMTEQHLVEYLTLLQKKGSRPATISRKWVVLGRFFAFLGQEAPILHCLPARPPTQEPPPTRPIPGQMASGQMVSPGQMETILTHLAASTARTARRDRALLMLLWESGARVSEVVELNHNDFDAGAAEIVLNRGREGQRIVPLSLAVADAICGYLAQPVLGGAVASGQEPLLRNQQGKRLTRQGIWLILRSIAQAAGIPNPVTPRRLQRAAAVRLLRATSNPQAYNLTGSANDCATGDEIPRLLLDGIAPVIHTPHPLDND